jgi:hypothetical protein
MLDFNVVKLDNFYEGDSITITQAPHGAQNGQAMDFILNPSNVGNLVAPWDGHVTYSSNQGKQSYFNFTLPDGSYIQFVHGLPHRSGSFKKGEPLGYPTHHHWHIGIFVTGRGWQRLLDYTRRDLNLIRGVVDGKPVGAQWVNWNTYADLHLNFYNPYMREQKLNEAKAWNDLIGEKNLIHDRVGVTPLEGAQKGSKIMNQVEGVERENLLMMYKEITDYIQSTSLKNDPDFDLMNARYSEYTLHSSAV